MGQTASPTIGQTRDRRPGAREVALLPEEAPPMRVAGAASTILRIVFKRGVAFRRLDRQSPALVGRHERHAPTIPIPGTFASQAARIHVGHHEEVHSRRQRRECRRKGGSRWRRRPGAARATCHGAQVVHQRAFHASRSGRANGGKCQHCHLSARCGKQCSRICPDIAWNRAVPRAAHVLHIVDARRRRARHR